METHLPNTAPITVPSDATSAILRPLSLEEAERDGEFTAMVLMVCQILIVCLQLVLNQFSTFQLGWISGCIGRNISPTTRVSVSNTHMFRMAPTALKGPHTLWQIISGLPSCCIHSSFTLRLECREIYAPSERHVCYPLHRGCSYAAAVYTTPGDVYALLRPSATLYLSSIITYRMLHSLHICLALRCGHLLQSSHPFGYITCHCIFFSIIVSYTTEIYCAILTLSTTMISVLHILRWWIISLRCLFLLICMSIVTILAIVSVDLTCFQVKPTMHSVLHILRWSIIGFRCVFLLIHIHIIAIVALIRIDITGSQVKPPELSRGPSSLAGGGDGIPLVAFVTCIFIIPTALRHPDMQFLIHTIAVYHDVWVSTSDSRLLKNHFRGQIVQNNCSVTTRSFHPDDHGRRCILCLLDRALDCSTSHFIHPLLVALWWYVPGIHQACIHVCNAWRG